MRPLTEHTPKPLLPVAGKPLIVWHLEKLAGIGVREVVINTSHLADQFPALLGSGRDWGLDLHYLHEGEQPLETGGGMLNALPWLGAAPFLVINGDVWTDFDFGLLPTEPDGLAELVMVGNPEHRPLGDFALDHGHRLRLDGPTRLTYAGIGMYRPHLLDDWQRTLGAEFTIDPARPARPCFPLAPLLRAAIRDDRVAGRLHTGAWTDVGTPERLAALTAEITADSRTSEAIRRP